MKVINKNDLLLLSDEAIVNEIIASGNLQPFEVLYDRYALKIFRKCVSFTKNEAEAQDLAHDIIVKIYLNLSQFAGKSKFSTWVYSITYNYCTDDQAKKKKQMTLTEELSKESGGDRVEEIDDEDLLNLDISNLERLLEKLSVAEKSILLMKYQDGFSIKDIATLTQSGESAVKMKIKRSKEKLMKLYRDGKRK